LLSVRFPSDPLGWIIKSPSRSSFKRLILGTPALSKAIMSGNNIKGTQEVLKDNECERGNVVNRPPISYVPPVDPHEKRDIEQIKVKLPDGMHFQMSAFRAGNNEEYIEHVISVLRLLDQKGIKSDIRKAFKVVEEIAKTLKPLTTPLPADASKLVKEERKLQKSVATEELQTTREGAITEITKAYELVCNYFVGEARTQWDKITLEMHSKDPWFGLDGESHSGLRRQTWASFMDCIELHKLTIFAVDAAETQRYYMHQSVKKPQRVSVRQYMAPMGLLND